MPQAANHRADLGQLSPSVAAASLGARYGPSHSGRRGGPFYHAERRSAKVAAGVLAPSRLLLGLPLRRAHAAASGPPSKRCAEGSGASRTRTGDLLGAIVGP
jgi:hypothetical protein